MRLFIAAIALLALTSAAHAELDKFFTSPGWYEVADTIYGPMLEQGPFAEESSCRAVLHPSDDEADYYCEYFATAPDWDY